MGFRLARLWWRVAQRPHEGALVAIYVGADMLLLRNSYRSTWSLPGGGVKPGEAPIDAARRELAEEIGLTADTIQPAGVFDGRWEGRPDRVHMFELRLDRLPDLRLDNREVVAARLFGADELDGVPVIGPLTAYLAANRS